MSINEGPFYSHFGRTHISLTPPQPDRTIIIHQVLLLCHLLALSVTYRLSLSGWSRNEVNVPPGRRREY